MIKLQFDVLPYHKNKPYKVEEICVQARVHTQRTLKSGVHKFSNKKKPSCHLKILGM